jgi:hypothetical protein
MKKNTGITRKQAIKRMGKYAALTAIGTFAILNPKKAQASSAPQDPGDDWWD